MYGKRIEGAWLVFDHWRNNRLNISLFITITLMNTIAIFLLIVASLLAVLTFSHIKKAHKISTQAVQLQKKLLIALCAQ
ncbi:hypothetical protein PENTCL1PPCAC_25361 [Pristionchus entomophagus]|uniref:G protein-coupled receptor n=1 Tax=Pristionchus entomophagus TaxID=358040 RepID=A0AAV5U8T0_9BILA|nr:hypothetical protein PENTCL1PPCAC_25361 [Pristionchus entomophagus]